MLLTITGMVQNSVSGNLMSLGALDFGLIVDGAVIIVENCLRRFGHGAAPARPAADARRALRAGGDARRVEVIKPSIFGVLIITLVYVPIFALTGVEGKMFHPMAFTVVFALTAALILSLTFVPAAVALFVTGKVEEKESAVMRGARAALSAGARLGAALRARSSSAARSAWCCVRPASRPRAWDRSSSRTSTRATSRCTRCAFLAPASRRPSRMQTQLEAAHCGDSRKSSASSRKIGTADIATDPMPPSVADTFVLLKAAQGLARSAQAEGAARRGTAKRRCSDIPGNNYEFTQPIQMRFNELISGVRADVAVKVFGDDLDAAAARLGERDRGRHRPAFAAPRT